MAVITPNTDLYLLKVPLEINDINQLDFANATAQYNYFNSLEKIAVDDFTYQRKDGTIRFPLQFDEIITYNYVMYRNTEYSDKWFYAFITNMEFVNDNMTAITIKTDVWQSWQFQLNYKPCLIDREHTNDDSIGANTLPEGLELGEYITNIGVENFCDGSDYVTVVEVSQIENTGENATLSYSWTSGSHSSTPFLNSIDRGTVPLILGLVSGAGNTASYITNLYDKAGLSDSIINVYMLPKKLVGDYYTLSLTVTVGGNTDTRGGIAVPATKEGVYDLGTYNFDKPSTLNNFIPKNNKLLTYPFCYFNLSNNAGTSIPFHYEDFIGNNIYFRCEGTFGVSGNIKAVPLEYKYLSALENAYDYSITAPKYPVCSWKSDSYTNWLTQNAVNMETQWKQTALSSAVDIVGGAITGGVGGAVLGTVAAGKNLIDTARSQMLAKTQANMVADQVRGNLGAGDIVWAKYRSPFTFMPMCIKAEYAKCIDDYFSQFGYKCNRIKRPNITGRRNWNYVKTVGCYIDADIPQADLAEIKAMFDNGITIWHDPVQFANYGADNDII